MQRRTVLKFLGVGAVSGGTGCIGPTAGSVDGTGTERHVSLSHPDTVLEEYELRIDASILEAVVTENHPARIQVTLTNEGPKRWLQVGRGCPLFWSYDWASSPGGVLLARGEEPSYVTEQGPRWVITPPEDGYFGDAGCGRQSYEEGESFQTEYAMYDDGRVNGYLDPGTYTFSDGFGMYQNADSDQEIVSWALDLTIESQD